MGLQESVDTPEKLDFKNDSCKWLKAISNHLAVSPFNKEHNFAAEIADWDLLALDVPRVNPWLGCLQSATFHAPTAPAASTTPSRWRLLRYGCAPGTTHQPGIEMVAFDMIGLEVASCYIVVCFPKLELWPLTWSLVSTDLLREAGQVLWVIYIHIYISTTASTWIFFYNMVSKCCQLTGSNIRFLAFNHDPAWCFTLDPQQPPSSAPWPFFFFHPWYTPMALWICSGSLCIKCPHTAQLWHWPRLLGREEVWCNSLRRNLGNLDHGSKSWKRVILKDSRRCNVSHAPFPGEHRISNSIRTITEGWCLLIPLQPHPYQLPIAWTLSIRHSHLAPPCRQHSPVQLNSSTLSCFGFAFPGLKKSPQNNQTCMVLGFQLT